MNDEGLILAGQALDRESDRYGCQRRARAEERLEERKGRSWGEMSMNGGKQASESIRLFNRKRISTVWSTSGMKDRYLFSSTGHNYSVQERGTGGRL